MDHNLVNTAVKIRIQIDRAKVMSKHEYDLLDDLLRLKEKMTSEELKQYAERVR